MYECLYKKLTRKISANTCFRREKPRDEGRLLRVQLGRPGPILIQVTQNSLEISAPNRLTFGDDGGGMPDAFEFLTSFWLEAASKAMLARVCPASIFRSIRPSVHPSEKVMVQQNNAASRRN